VNLAEIKIFSHEVFGNIRTLTNENGETFFVGNDVAKALGYAKPQNALSAHVDNEDKGTAPIQGTAYETRVTIINESGLYALVLSSKLPQAKAFKRWVTSEVLPQIRRTGGYIPTRNARTGEEMTESELVEVAQQIMSRTIAHNNLPADDCLTATDVANSIGLDTKTLNQMLVDWGIMYWSGARYKLTAKYAERGYDSVRYHHYFALNGQKKVRPYLVWTPQGSEFIKSMFN
jgi:prophage antirepressor-like protein